MSNLFVMRDMDTPEHRRGSPVVWPSWCYNSSDNGKEMNGNPPRTPSTRGRKKRRGTNSSVCLDFSHSTGNGNGIITGNNNNCGGGTNGAGGSSGGSGGTPSVLSTSVSIGNGQFTENATSPKREVKTELTSPPCSRLDGNSSGSGSASGSRTESNTPSSSYADNMSSPSVSPATSAQGLGSATFSSKNQDQPVQQQPVRNYSDIMRSLAAKYNHSNPNDYFNHSRPADTSGFGDSRFSRFKSNSAFMNIVSPLTTSPTEISQKDSHENLFSTFRFANSASSMPLFSSLVDMNSTQALLNMVCTARATVDGAPKRHLESNNNNPLDLSSSFPSTKKIRKENFLKFPNCASPKIHDEGSSSRLPCVSTCEGDEDKEDTSNWSVDDVCNFVSSIEHCEEYVSSFREQNIDGASLPLLTEEHLRSALNMKLGPALKFRAVLAKKIGKCAVCIHCIHCHNQTPTLSLPTVSPPCRSPRENS